MTHDHTYLSQLPIETLLDRAFRGNWTGPEAHMIRILAAELENYFYDHERLDKLVSELTDDLKDAERRANSWREEAQAVQRQLDQVRG
jgi:hypothetical protein